MFHDEIKKVRVNFTCLLQTSPMDSYQLPGVSEDVEGKDH